MTTFSADVTFPQTASRLVGINIEKSGYGQIRADNISVISDSLTMEPVPHLQSLAPPNVLYGETIELTGTNFGSSPGTILVGGAPNGVTVLSWSPTKITARIDGECIGGNVQADTGGPRTCEVRRLTIDSPHFLIDRHIGGSMMMPGEGGDNAIVVAGERLKVAVRVSFRNGFTTTGGIQLSVPGSTAASFSPNPVMRDGGSLLSFDTGGLSPGSHTFTILAEEGGASSRSTTFQVDVRQPATLVLTDNDRNPIDGATFISQSPVTMITSCADPLGNDLTFTVDKPQWSSSNPSVAEVFQSASPWGDFKLLPHHSGNATIRARYPDGTTFDHDVTVAIPAEPRATAHYCVAPVMSNNPSISNTLYILWTGAMSASGYSIGDLGIEVIDSQWGPGNTSYSAEFKVTETMFEGAAQPAKIGTYLFTSSATVALSDGGSQSAASGCVFHVVNDPATALIQGTVSQFGGSMAGHGANGILEFYNAGTGDLAFKQLIWEWTNDYSAPRIPPGTYKVRLVPESFSPDSPRPQWYPNAENFADAQSLTLGAGDTLNSINFTLSPPPGGPPAPRITVAPTHDPVAQTFRTSIQTLNGVNYSLQKSKTMADGSWFTIQTIWGSGSEAMFEDTAATEPGAFYRIITE